MRMIILILIFINLAFFYWARESNFNEVMLENPESISGYAPIMLLSELGASRADDNEIVKEKQNQQQEIALASQQADKCFSLG